MHSKELFFRIYEIFPIFINVIMLKHKRYRQISTKNRTNKLYQCTDDPVPNSGKQIYLTKMN